MKINRLSYTNKASGWDLKPLEFDQLTLLVGASGVDKTRILKSILDLKKNAPYLNMGVLSIFFTTLGLQGRRAAVSLG